MSTHAHAGLPMGHRLPQHTVSRADCVSVTTRVVVAPHPVESHYRGPYEGKPLFAMLFESYIESHHILSEITEFQSHLYHVSRLLSNDCCSVRVSVTKRDEFGAAPANAAVEIRSSLSSSMSLLQPVDESYSTVPTGDRWLPCPFSSPVKKEPSLIGSGVRSERELEVGGRRGADLCVRVRGVGFLIDVLVDRLVASGADLDVHAVSFAVGIVVGLVVVVVVVK